MSTADYEDLAKWRASTKILRYKAFDIVNDPQYDRYQKGPASIVSNFLIKQNTGTCVINKASVSFNSTKRNQQLPAHLNKAIIRKFQKMLRMFIFDE